MTLLHEQLDVAYLPFPNSVGFFLSPDITPLALTKTSFMVPLLWDGSVVMANNRRRGLEFPGGHINPGESPCQGAHRETVEETGYWVSAIRALGYLEMRSQGDVPDDWKYPHPLSYQQFFVGRVMSSVAYVENDECLNPVVLSPEEARVLLRPNRLVIYEAACDVLGIKTHHA